MSLTYQTYYQAAQTLSVVPLNNTDTAFSTIFPRAIEYAEGRIYRDFQFLCTLASQTTTVTASVRSVALPTNVIDTQSINIITPSTQTNPELGTRNPVTRVGIDFLNAIYNSSSGAGVPKFYDIIGSPTIGSTITAGTYNILFGPFPDAAYTVEVIGTVRPSPISPTNTSTFLSTQLPDLLIAATMVFIAGYQRDYGQQADDPKLALSWEQQYETLKASANLEELRRKSAASGWTTYTPTPEANAPRAP